MQRSVSARRWVCGVLLLVVLTGSRVGWAQPPSVTTATAEATRPGVPPASVPPSETLGWSITFGLLANELLRRAKASKYFPAVTTGAGKINVVLSALLAAGAAAGIHTEFDRVAGALSITGLTFSNIYHFAGEWVRQYAIQQFTYQSMKSSYSNGTAALPAAKG